MKSYFKNQILKNFDEASFNYNNEALLQKIFADKLAKSCSEQSIPKGLWVDLGSGTGLLANAIETFHPNHSVIRIDGSKAMLKQHSQKQKVQLWDLNLGLPEWTKKPTLIASNFALHWLVNPQGKLKEWFSALAPGGLLAIALPVEGSFPEWYEASSKAKVKCTATYLPSSTSLINAIQNKNIQYKQLERFTQQSKNVTSLLKPLVKIGAHSTQNDSLNVGEWRKVKRNWPLAPSTNELQLTWSIQILIARK